MCSTVLDGINHIAEIQKTAIGVSLLLFISLGLAARNGSEPQIPKNFRV
jgi:hypothetical protein